MADAKTAPTAPETDAASAPEIPIPTPEEVVPARSRPALPSATQQRFLEADAPPGEGSTRTYRPALLGKIKLHFSRSTYKVDRWETRSFLAPLSGDATASPWDASAPVEPETLGTQRQPEPDVSFARWPAAMTQSKSYTSWKKQLADYCYRTQARPLWKCPELKTYSQLGESEGDFRVRLAQLAREKRDLAVEKLRKRYAGKLATLNGRIQTAQARIQREKSEYRKASLDSAVSFGSSVLGALFGRKLASVTNVRRAKSSMKTIGSAAKQRDDVKLAQKKLAEYRQQQKELERRFGEDCRKLEHAYRAESLDLEPLSLKPKKSDLQVDAIEVAWIPWDVDGSGIATAALPDMPDCR